MNGTEWCRVFATHCEEQVLAWSPWLGEHFPGIALPSSKARHRWVQLRYGDRTTFAQVVDIGPFCIDDDAYVFGTERPRAEIFKGKPCKVRLDSDELPTVPNPDGTKKTIFISNGAGLDMFPRVARELGIPINTNVSLEWRWALI